MGDHRLIHVLFNETCHYRNQLTRGKTMTTKDVMNTYRTTARVVGVVYLAGFVVGIVGDMLIQSILGAPNRLATVSANSLPVAIGALLWLMAVAGDAAHGVLMFPVLKPHNERIAVGYLAARLVEAIFMAVMVLCILIQIPLASEYVKAAAPQSVSLQALSTVSVQARQYAYALGMSTVGVSGVLLCYTLYRAKLVPRLVAVWGLIGYAIILCGMVSEIMGSGLGLVSSIPGGLWEVFMGVWLIAKGFSSSPVPAERTTSSTTPIMTSPTGASSIH